MRAMVEIRFLEMKQAVMKVFQDTKSKLSFTIDGWTSISNKSYYGITGHFIDEKWNLNSLVIDFVPSNGHHTGRDIAKLFYDCLQEFHLLKKIQGITVDNASANTKFMSELSLLINSTDEGCFDAEDQHFRCFAHVINLAVQDMLRKLTVEEDTEVESDGDDDSIEEGLPDNESKSPLKKLRCLFKKIKYSEQLRNKYKSCCESLNLKMIAPNIDVSTRWNSTHDMLSTAINMKLALNLLCENNEDLVNLRISENEWLLLTYAFKFLRYFKSLSTALGGEKYVTLPLVIIGYNMLLDKIESAIQKLIQTKKKSHIEITLQYALKSSLEKLLKHYRKANWVYCAILILDPRHKMETFQLTNWGREMADASYQKFENMYRNSYCTIQPSTTHTPAIEAGHHDSDDDDLLDLSFLFETDSTSVRDQSEPNGLKEVGHYLSMKRADKDTNVLVWWKEHEKQFPCLSRMARDFFSTPATSVPAERLFSRASLTIRKHRNRLTNESARNLLCINSWVTLNPDLTEQIQLHIKSIEQDKVRID